MGASIECILERGLLYGRARRGMGMASLGGGLICYLGTVCYLVLNMGSLFSFLWVSYCSASNHIFRIIVPSESAKSAVEPGQLHYSFAVSQTPDIIPFGLLVQYLQRNSIYFSLGVGHSRSLIHTQLCWYTDVSLIRASTWLHCGRFTSLMPRWLYTS